MNGASASDESGHPYLWRYRKETVGDMEPIDMLLLPLESEEIIEDDGETTIVWWDDD